jgi:hypothetical protein
MEGPLLALHRGVMGTLLVLRRGVVWALLALQRCIVGTYVVARWMTTEVARWTWRSCAGVIEGTTSIRISGVRVPVINVTLVAFTGGTAVGALVMWLFWVQPDLPRLTDKGVAPVAEMVASELSAGDHATTVYAATSRTIPVEEQGTVPSPVSGPMVIRSAAMTVTSTPEGARVTVNGIGWGETPVTISHLPPGQKVVRVTKEGYESQQRIISIPDDRRSADIRVTLLASR